MDIFKNNLLNSIQNIPTKILEREIGVIVNVSESIIIVDGLEKIGYDEAVLVKKKYYGYVASMEGSLIKVVMLDNIRDITIGDEVSRTGHSIHVPVGEGLIGRVVDGIGRPLDNKGRVVCTDYLPAERPAKGVLERKTVNIPLETGIKVIDFLIPIGKGQRQLILGDRQLGKTSIAIDTILNQKGRDVICIYCSTGQRDSSVMNVINILESNRAMEYTIVVDANSTSGAGLQYVAPYSATSMAEYFCEKGRDVLIIYDDLTKHAKIYREISLLLERSPGREAFPGDVFYLHSRLLERSVNLVSGGSITSLPIIETEGENISAYIPTNVISITDGQLYLSPSNFQKSIFPAIDIGKSVSRVGGKAQQKALKQVVGRLGVEYSQFEELEAFSKFSTKLDERTQNVINKGNLIRKILQQDIHKPVSMEGEIGILMALNAGLFDNVKSVVKTQRDIVAIMEKEFSFLGKIIRKNNLLLDEQIEKFLERAREILELK